MSSRRTSCSRILPAVPGRTAVRFDEVGDLRITNAWVSVTINQSRRWPVLVGMVKESQRIDSYQDQRPLVHAGRLQV